MYLFYASASGLQGNAGVPGEYERPGVLGPIDQIDEVFDKRLKGCEFESLFYI